MEVAQTGGTDTHPGEGGGVIFQNRTEAGRELAERLTANANRGDVIVLGIPRGGVILAYEVARELNAPLDVFMLRKLGVPGHEEVAFGAIASCGVRVLDRLAIGVLGLSNLDIELVTAVERKELKRRELAYRGERPALLVKGLTVIVVDDGIATGASMYAGLTALRQLEPAHIVVAVPVAPPSACNLLKPEVDELVCVYAPPSFRGVGQFYDDFSQVSDAEVIELLKRAKPSVVQSAP